jgi:hypothetical protein
VRHARACAASFGFLTGELLPALSSRDEVTCQTQVPFGEFSSEWGEVRDRGEVDDGESLWDARVAR